MQKKQSESPKNEIFALKTPCTIPETIFSGAAENIEKIVD
jgi:hypothetical protein